MRLYVNCHNCGNRIYIDSPALHRRELPQEFILSHEDFADVYSRNDVYAEPEYRGALTGGVILGILGALAAGPLGAFLGGTVGVKIGHNEDVLDRRRAIEFNNSRV